MDLDELKDRTRFVRAPAFKSGRGADPGAAADDLIDRIKAEDAKDAKALRGMLLLFGIVGSFVTFLFVLTWLFPPDQDPNFHRVLLALMGVLFLSLGGILRAKFRELSGMDYAMPVRQFLESSEKRHSFLPWRQWSFSIPYVFFMLALLATCGVSWINAMHRYFPTVQDSTGILIYCAVITVAGVIGLVIGRNDWKKRKAPILEELRRMKAELLQDETEVRNGSEGVD